MNSELSEGEGFINQPVPLTSRSLGIVPALGTSRLLKLVMIASANSPIYDLVVAHLD